MSPIIDFQRRLMELGRIRLGGNKRGNQPGEKLSHFRLTSASRALLEAAADLYGGSVARWEGAPDEGYFELMTTSAELDIMLPPVLSMVDGTPTVPWSQWYEHWSGGGCLRRCDGQTELLSGQPCMCNPDERLCKVKTRISVMLPRVPGIGVWRLDTGGINAAMELPGTLEALRMAAEMNRFIPAVLSIHHRSDKRNGQTRRYIVPVITLPGTTVVGELAASGQPLVLNPPARVERAALPPVPGEILPSDPKFANDQVPEMGSPPPLPIPADRTMYLLELASKIGNHEHVLETVVKHQAGHNIQEHRTWLERQIKSAEKKVGAAV
jgi:hypothetical protein